MVIIEDWREAAPEVVGPLFDAECTRWHGTLGWDYRPSCQMLEGARVRRRLPGFLARDARRAIVGWTYYLLHDSTLHIGNLVAADSAVVSALLDAVLHAPESRHAGRLSCFLYPTSPTIETALKRRRFAIERHAYMERRLLRSGEIRLKADPTGCGEIRLSADPTVGGRGIRLQPDLPGAYRMRAWAAYAIPDLVPLFAEAYQGMQQSRCFAPDGRVDQWTSYVAQLIQTPACGRFEQALSMVIETPGGGLAGAVLVTALAPGTAHIAQMAVAAPHRGRGLGRMLVESACDRAAAARYDRMTLIVAESNERASRLYERLGFERTARFVFADRTVKS